MICRLQSWRWCGDDVNLNLDRWNVLHTFWAGLPGRRLEVVSLYLGGWGGGSISKHLIFCVWQNFWVWVIRRPWFWLAQADSQDFTSFLQKIDRRWWWAVQKCRPCLPFKLSNHGFHWFENGFKLWVFLGPLQYCWITVGLSQVGWEP